MFGEKGAGKTALRLQIARHLEKYNQEHPTERIYVIEYDDFNPFLDRFRDRFGARHRSTDRLLADWKLWDHMDAILSLGVTGIHGQQFDRDGFRPDRSDARRTPANARIAGADETGAG